MNINEFYVFIIPMGWMTCINLKYVHFAEDSFLCFGAIQATFVALVLGNCPAHPAVASCVQHVTYREDPAVNIVNPMNLQLD